MKKLLILTFLFYNDYLSGQVYFDELYGKSDPFIESTISVIETTDSGYIFPLFSVSWTEDTNQIIIIKVDKFGHKQWGNIHSATNSLHQSAKIIGYGMDSLLIVGGEYFTDSAKVYLELLDPLGNLIWKRNYTNGSLNCVGVDISKTNEGDFLICGFDEDWNIETNQPVLGQMVVYKIDNAGSIIWETTWGSSILVEGGYSITETADNGCLVAGVKIIPGGGDFVGLVVKFDSLGTFQWKKEFGIAIHNEAFSKIIPTYDGNYLLIGGYGYDGWDNPPTYISGQGGMMAKIDPQGATLWFKKYEGEIQQAAFNDALEMPDHSIVVVGENQPGGFASLLKFDEEGNLIWQQLYNRNPDLSESLYAVIPTQDNGFLLAGDAFPIVPSGQGNATDAWLLKVDSIGCPEPLCVPVPVAVEEPPRVEVTRLEVFPNPFTASLHLRLPPTVAAKPCRIRISDTAGRVLITLDTKGKEEVVIATGHLPAGMFFVTVEAEGYQGVEKVVKFSGE